MIRLAVIHINLSKELKLDMISCFLGVRVTGKGQAGRLEIDIDFLYIRR